jgi:hypothetical protein
MKHYWKLEFNINQSDLSNLTDLGELLLIRFEFTVLAEIKSKKKLGSKQIPTPRFIQYQEFKDFSYYINERVPFCSDR